MEPLVRATRANAVTALASSPWAPVFAVAGQKQVALYNSDTLDLLGHQEWARLTRLAGGAEFDAGATGVIDQDWR